VFANVIESYFAGKEASISATKLFNFSWLLRSSNIVKVNVELVVSLPAILDTGSAHSLLKTVLTDWMDLHKKSHLLSDMHL
jgi:hypothetical protein